MGHFMDHAPEGSVLHVCTKFEADKSIPSKVIQGSQNWEIGSRDSGHAHLRLAAGVMKHGASGKIVKEFVGLRAKLYSFKTLEDAKEHKDLKE